MSDAENNRRLSALKSNPPPDDEGIVDFSHIPPWVQEHIVEIGQVLGGNADVKRIELMGNNLTDDHIAKLCRGLEDSTSLTHIVMTGNAATAKSVPVLKKLIQSVPTLTSIIVSHNKLSPDDRQQIVDAIKDPSRPKVKAASSSSSSSVSSSRGSTSGSSKDRKSRKSRKSSSSSSSASSSSSKSGSSTASSAREQELEGQLAAMKQTERELRNKISSLEKAIVLAAKKSEDDGVHIINLRFENVIQSEKLAETGGSNAGVYACYVNGWQCALKVLNKPTGFLADQSLLDGFLQEITLLESLPNHRNLVRYLFHEETPTQIKLYMTKYSGSLGSEIRKAARNNMRFTPEDITLWLLQILSGVGFLHGQGIIHRDLKADNIFVVKNESGNVSTCVVGDLDTAKAIGADRTKTLVGTPAFIAPEVSRCDAYSYAADIFSFGMIVYECLALRLPFIETDVFRITDKILQGDKPIMPPLPESYQGLVAIHEVCVSLKPSDRPSLTQIRDALRQLQDQ